MPGHVDLRHDGNETIGGIGHEVGVLLLRVVATRSSSHLPAPANSRQVRPRLDLEAPSLVVGQVQVQRVQFVQRHRVDVALHVIDGEEMACHVEHRATPRITRAIDDLDAGNDQTSPGRRAVLHVNREQLSQRLHSAEQSRGSRGTERHPVTPGAECVAFSAQCVGGNDEADAPRCTLIAGGEALHSRRSGGCQHLGQLVSHPFDVGRGVGGDDDRRAIAYDEGIAARLASAQWRGNERHHAREGRSGG